MKFLTLGELGNFKNGVNFRNDKMGYGIPLINVKDITNAHWIDIPSLDLVGIDPAPSMIASYDDLFFVRSSVKLDGIALVSKLRSVEFPSVHCGFVIRFRPESRDVCSDYLLYLLRSPEYRARLKNLSSGATIVNISQSNLGCLRIPLRSVVEQRRVADILSTYDDLIENNRRRMALLEESTRLLYREWFVSLRFPGYEHTRIIDGVPAGWEQLKAPEVIEINPSTKLSDENEHWWVEMSDLSTNSMVIMNSIKRAGRSGSKFRNGDTLFARITPCLENGKTGYVNFMSDGDVGRGSTEFIILRSKLVTPEFVYCLARTYHFRENAIKSMLGSSGRQRVQESCFKEFDVLVPPRSLLSLFSEFAEPVFQQVKTVHIQNQKLRQARDILLPLLINGEIAV